MGYAFRNVVLVGERAAKLDFICGLVGEYSRVSLREKCRDASPVVEVASSGDLSEKVVADEGKNRVLVLAAAFPDGVKISADLSERDWIICENAKDAELVLFVEGFPFTTDALCGKVEKVEKFLMDRLQHNSLGNVQFRVVFFRDKDQRFGVTDMVDIDAAFKSAQGIVAQRLGKSDKVMLPLGSLVDYKEYGGREDLAGILSYGVSAFALLSAVSREQFERWRGRLGWYCKDYRLDYDSQFGTTLRFETRMHDYVYKFSAVKGSGDLMRRYAENYREKYFEEVKELATKLYRQYVKGICFWDIEKDIAALEDGLDRLCMASLVFNEKIACPKDQAGYQNVLAGRKINILFSAKARRLEKGEVPEMVCEYLKEKEDVLRKSWGTILS